MNSKALLLSIKPQYVSLIESGVKKFELRRKCPKVIEGDLVLVYESSPTKSLVGAFSIGRIHNDTPKTIWRLVGHESGVSKEAFFDYFKGTNTACALEIKKYWCLTNPVCINEMRSRTKIDPPQSFRYLCERQTGNLLNT